MYKADIPGLKDYMSRFKDEDDDDPCKPEGGIALRIYQILEEPGSGTVAWLFSALSISMILLSVTLVCLETLPDVENDVHATSILDSVDFGVVIFFTVEYFARLLVNVEKVRFLYQGLNVVDVIAIFPSYITFFVPAARDFNGAKLLKVLRVLRVFKLTRHSDGMLVLAKTGIACSNELGLLFFCLIVFTILFSALVFVSEEQDHEGPTFRSIPHSFWWAVVTITTVGYGDMYPTTGLGQLFGALCALTGVVMVALPISVISSTFNGKFIEQRQQQEVRERRRQRDRVTASRSMTKWGFERVQPAASLGTVVKTRSRTYSRASAATSGSSGRAAPVGMHGGARPSTGPCERSPPP
mmetsp:Transcript_61711/g.151893  ORF Transcript_61711/g.151893 Transcript_61711/m.151893 type:complete len:355 (-) Transcript_61711:9-1073(-)